MDNETTQQLIKMARQLLAMCDGDVNSISIHADKIDHMPYTTVYAYGPESEAPLLSWFDFPEDEL